MAFYIGIDLGTSSVKVILLDESLEIVEQTDRDYPLNHPNPGWAEQDPGLWWEAVRDALEEIFSSSNLSSEDVIVGVTGQMHGVVPLDQNGEPVYPAIIWADRRTTEEVELITDRLNQQQFTRLSNPVTNGFTAPKLLWLLRHSDQLSGELDQVLLPKDYIIYRLTGEYVTEEADASATLLFDVKNRHWDQEVLEKLEIPGDILPPVTEPGSIAGEISSKIGQKLGMGSRGIPVVAAGGDAPLAALANGITRSGRVSISIGTAGQVLTTLDNYRVDPEFRLHTLCHGLPGKWYMMGAMTAAGYCLQWWHDRLNQDKKDLTYKEMMKQARKSPAAARGLIFLPYLNGERSPHMDPFASGVLFGLTGEHDLGDITRAIMEGVAFAYRENLEIMKELGISADTIYLTGGGSRNQLWCQIIASVLQQEVYRFSEEHSSAYGAALSAASAAGNLEFEELFAEMDNSKLTTLPPERGDVQVYDKAFSLYKTLYRQNRGIYRELSKLR